MTFSPPTAIAVRNKLLEIFGPIDWRPTLSPVAELVSTILSQSTTDLNRDRAFKRLKDRFGDWEGVRDGRVDEIEAAIRVAGLSKQKAPRIKAALEFVTETQGALTLDFLKAMPVGEARAWLTQMKGDAPKTASIIL